MEEARKAISTTLLPRTYWCMYGRQVELASGTQVTSLRQTAGQYYTHSVAHHQTRGQKDLWSDELSTQDW